MPATPLARMVEEFAEHLLGVDLPRLPADRRGEAAAFARRRVAAMPTPLRAAVAPVAVAVHGVGRSLGGARLARLLARRPIPVLDDYVRLVRSLAFTYVWDRWPSTAADGAPR
jgi:hypothetical protein